MSLPPVSVNVNVCAQQNTAESIQRSPDFTVGLQVSASSKNQVPTAPHQLSPVGVCVRRKSTADCHRCYNYNRYKVILTIGMKTSSTMFRADSDTCSCLESNSWSNLPRMSHEVDSIEGYVNQRKKNYNTAETLFSPFCSL